MLPWQSRLITEETLVASHRVGILGCGNIFGRYVAGMARYPELEIVRVVDVDVGRAKKAAGSLDGPWRAHNRPARGSVWIL
jgi:predicted dehydrogenase